MHEDSCTYVVSRVLDLASFANSGETAAPLSAALTSSTVVELTISPDLTGAHAVGVRLDDTSRLVSSCSRQTGGGGKRERLREQECKSTEDDGRELHCEGEIYPFLVLRDVSSYFERRLWRLGMSNPACYFISRCDTPLQTNINHPFTKHSPQRLADRSHSLAARE